MLRSLAVIPVVLLALASGCNSPRSSTSSPEVQAAATGEPFTLARGESADVAGHSLRFVDVVEDSRCPTGTTCVWAGRAKVRLSASDPDGEEATQVLTLAYPGIPQDESPEWRVGGVRVEFLDLLPMPTSGDSAPAQREVQLRVTAEQ